MIFQAVKKALEASPFDIDAERLTIKIIVEITPFVETGVKEEVIKQKEQNDGLVKLLGGNLKTAITDAIQGLDLKSVPISDDMSAEILRVIPPRYVGIHKLR